MVYIRAKQVKGIDYAYLVKSEWDGKNKTARQVTIKYLGKASDVELEDIPADYRNNSQIISFLSTHNLQDMNKKSKMIEDFRSRLFNCLSSSDSHLAFELYKETQDALSLEGFYDRILRVVLYDVGDRWEKGKLDVTTEHIASNTSRVLISSIMMMMGEKGHVGRSNRSEVEGMEKKSNNNERPVIFICCPEGELHHTPGLVLESVLRSKGFRVINASPSNPSDSVLHYIDAHSPDLIMVSVTLPENIGAAKRLVGEISKKFHSKEVPIIVGGSAFKNFQGDFPNVTSVASPDIQLEDIVRIVRSSLRASGMKRKRATTAAATTLR